MADLSFIRPEDYIPESWATNPENAPAQAATASDDPAAAVNALLAQLGTARPPEPHKLKTWQRVLGGLGDAIQAAAAVRAGGQAPPIGPFAAGQRERRMMYEQQVADVDRFNRETERTIRVGQFEEGQRRQREESLARIKAQTVDPLELRRIEETERHNREQERRMSGRAHTRLVYDPQGNAYEQDIDTQEVRPIKLPTGGQASRPLSGEDIERGAKLGGFSQGLSRLKELLPRFISSKGGASRIGQQVAREVPIIGAQISERISKEGEVVAAVLDRVRADFIRIMSGLQASELEQKRLRKTLPDLGTIDAQTALDKIIEFEAGVKAFAQEKYRLKPQLFSPSLIEELGLETAGSTGGQYNGIVLHESDFADAAPGERERFIAGGGTVEP